MALTLPKLALPALTLSRRQILTIAGGVIVLCVLGWFGWQYFEDAGPAPAPPGRPLAVTPAKPAAAAKAVADTGPARDKLIEDLLVASGLKQQLSQLPQKLITGIKQSGKQQAKASPEVLRTIENAVTESLAAQGFHDRVSAGLKKNFDGKRVQALIKDFSTPAAKRMIELEQASPAQEDLAQFARSAAATRPAPERASLVKRIDAATRASDLATEVAFTFMKGIASGAGGGDKAAAVDKAIEKQRASVADSIRNATLLNLAFSYRNASDAELDAHAKLYETENSKWLNAIVYDSVLEEAQSASARAGERIAARASESASPAAKPAGAKAGADARACLALATNSAVMKCAEKYR